MPTPMRGCPERRPSTIKVLFLLLFIGLLVAWQPLDVQAQISIFEPFDDSMTQNPAWILSGAASLTAGRGWVAAADPECHGSNRCGHFGRAVFCGRTVGDPV